ncbi:Bacterial alpha-L-rhamnosidase [Posidoniimonas polymericola]|uniref:alpha-L-rhamnosidase n=1 Tax=Posidoniimonas polymericola TaxID=2528002 RepID=A0A5C5ZFL5_9BACT|nr:alpha-L-rhamnosidase [Posidoniimonas polymericola]TWT85996.1 Bacterial alpha-L-rhamnosidase [Posidoniimonas polymericola]
MLARTIALLFALVLLSACDARAAGLTAENLRCEQLRNPTGVDAVPPRLSWTLASDERGQLQTAYQLRVASTKEKLAAGEADLWDTGRVESGECVLIPYAGRPLHSHQACYWHVRVWGREGRPSPWSKPQHWLMGLLHQSDWTGAWIGLPVPERIEHVQDADWIWHNEAEPTKSAPAGERYFRRAFDVDGAKQVRRAVFRITADDRVDIYLNGRNLGSRSGPNSTKELSVTHRLLAGRNVIAVRAKNDESGTPAGVIAWLEIHYADGSRQLVASDAEWRSHNTEEDGWLESDFDDSAWRPVKVLGAVGMQPWGDVRHAEDRTLPARHLRKEFAIEGPIKRAVVSYSGLGVSVLRINGQRIGDAVLSPAMTQYDKRVPYVTHDVTAALREGDNAVGIVLANGRYYAPRSEVYAAMVQYGTPKLNFCLWIERPDGSVTPVVSDASWRLTDEGPVRANNEYDGEHYDARRELPGWDQLGFDDSDWRPAEVLPEDPAELSSAGIAPMRVMQTLKPVGLSEVKPGVWVYDLGQNMVGWCRLKVQGPAGATVRLRHAEVLRPDGMIDAANLRTAEATDSYTLRGFCDEEVWEPEFILHGFRYVEVTGWPGEPTLESLEGRVLHDDLEEVGEFSCSNELLNQVYQNAVWGFRGNYRSVPTDCPQRDERQGWLGDRFEIARGESYVFGVGPLYAKWLRDIRDAQRPSGSLPDVAPTHWPTFSDNVVWPSATIILPDMLRRQYADRQPTREQYACNKRWVEFMSGFVEDGLISRDSYGDWCVPPEDPHLIHSEDPARITDTTLLASAFFAYDLRVLSEQAKLLGEPQEASRLAAQSETMARAINAKFLKDGRYANNTQTSSVIPLALGVTPSDQQQAVFHSLVARIEGNDRHIATGLVGGQHLLRTLTDGGRPDLAFAIATQRDYPSWGYMVDQGATTIWELWNGVTADPAMNSHNHVMLVGDLVTWMYEDLAGIAPDPAAEGFRKILMRPQLVQGLDWVKSSHRSPYGKIESAWSRAAGEVKWRVCIPPGATATLIIPAAGPIEVNGVTVEDAVENTNAADGVTHFEFGSGVYRFTFPSGE